MTGIAKKTVMRLLGEIGTFCLGYQDAVFQNLNCKRLQVDEMWSFVYAKQKNVTPAIAAKVQSTGDAWLWVAIDADSKRVDSWAIGPRDAATARDFMEDVAGRLAHRVQITSDGLKVYIKAIESAVGSAVDYSESGLPPMRCRSHPMHFAGLYRFSRDRSHRFSPASNTNAFSKKIENHIAAVALGYIAYNFIKIHRTLPHDSGNGRWRHGSALGR